VETVVAVAVEGEVAGDGGTGGSENRFMPQVVVEAQRQQDY